MAIDRKRSDWTRQFDLPLAVGQSFTEEGQIVTEALSSGVSVASRGAASGSLVPVGFAMLTQVSPGSTRMYTTEAVVPSTPDGSSEYIVDIGHTLITSAINALGDVAVYDRTAAAFLTLVAAGAPASGEFALKSGAAGTIEFHADEAGHEIDVYARVTMTAREQVGLFGQRNINANSQADLEMVGVIGGQGVLYTDQFDVSVGSWASGTLTTGAGGVFTMGGGGTALTTRAHVIKVPTVDDPWLGIRFNLGQ